jgi:cysteinyl-tRNA synthetase
LNWLSPVVTFAGLAVGVVSLGLQVAGGITGYIDALHFRDQDISSVRRQNDRLQKTLRVVETSISQLQCDHQDATAEVQECLNSCNNELKALESLVANFTACDQSTTGQKIKIKDKGKKLLYPFSRPKLEQLETKLRDANAALQLALQTLGL